MKFSFSKIAFFLTVPLAAAASYYFVFVYPVSSAPPPVISEVIDFELTDSDEKIFKREALHGKIWLADIMFTSCPMTCPMLTRKMKNVSLSFALDERVRFVSVSVDPKNDTPAVLRQFAKKYEIDTKKWHLLTGDMEKIRELAVKGLKLAADNDPALHSEYFVLVDSLYRVRGYYDPKDKSAMQKLIRDMALLLKETPDEAAHDS